MDGQETGDGTSTPTQDTDDFQKNNPSLLSAISSTPLRLSLGRPLLPAPQPLDNCHAWQASRGPVDDGRDGAGRDSQCNCCTGCNLLMPSLTLLFGPPPPPSPRPVSRCVRRSGFAPHLITPRTITPSPTPASFRTPQHLPHRAAPHRNGGAPWDCRTAGWNTDSATIVRCRGSHGSREVTVRDLDRPMAMDTLRYQQIADPKHHAHHLLGAMIALRDGASTRTTREHPEFRHPRMSSEKPRFPSAVFPGIARWTPASQPGPSPLAHTALSRSLVRQRPGPVCYKTRSRHGGLRPPGRTTSGGVSPAIVDTFQSHMPTALPCNLRDGRPSLSLANSSPFQ
ncbi:hypothetical protein CMUS01_07490 [Colletotrichum musicola]|uniref:Uncharacterized protein n=1 Tax=Colletotrichum musicola TaxID=2175873 RepID=A0A8H6KGV1_9PEZI|nr:hypothetical protein CMUS01_07490 [Colletotrichum musicola]